MRFGILMAVLPGRAPFRYRFTAQDALWLGRYLAAAGPRARGRRRMLAWRAMQHFVDASGQMGSITFGEFVQQRAPSIPRAPWQALSPRTRALAIAATTGRLAPVAGDQRVFVRPPRVARAAYAPTGPRWSQGDYQHEYEQEYGQDYEQEYGQNYEQEYEHEYEAAPGETPPPNEAPQSPPTPPTNGTQPPVEASNAPDADAWPDGSDGEPPMDEPPPGPPVDFNTADGNTLSLTPQLIQQVLAALRRYPRHYWRRKYPWLGQALTGSGSGWQPWSGRQWTGSAWTTRPYWGQRPWLGAWSGQTWRARPGVIARPRGAFGAWGGRPLMSSPMNARRWQAGRPIVQRMRQLARASRKIGTLRSRRTGQRYPVFGARSGGRNYRIVTRPRRNGMQHEIVLVRSGPFGAERHA